MKIVYVQKKGVLLPFKIVGVDGKLFTNVYVNNEEMSVVEWKHLQYYNTKPTVK